MNAPAARHAPAAVLRTLLESDLPALNSLLAGFGREDRLRRFGTAISDAGIAQHCRGIADAGQATRVIGVFEAGRLVAAAELWFGGETPSQSCEVAVEVAAHRRGQGFGKRLLGRAVLVARNRWIPRMHLSCVLENRPMQHIARQFTAELRFEDGSAEAEILLPYPSWQSLWAETVMDTAGFVAAPQVGAWVGKLMDGVDGLQRSLVGGMPAPGIIPRRP